LSGGHTQINTDGQSRNPKQEMRIKHERREHLAAKNAQNAKEEIRIFETKFWINVRDKV
jgi:hypothetical protein